MLAFNNLILGSRGFECVDLILGFFCSLTFDFELSILCGFAKGYICAVVIVVFWVNSNVRLELLWLSLSLMCFENEKWFNFEFVIDDMWWIIKLWDLRGTRNTIKVMGLQRKKEKMKMKIKKLTLCDDCYLAIFLFY